MKASPKENQKLAGSIKLYSSLSLQVAKAVSFKHIFTSILTSCLEKHRLGKSFCKPYLHLIVLNTDSYSDFMTFLRKFLQYDQLLKSISPASKKSNNSYRQNNVFKGNSFQKFTCDIMIFNIK